jgi:hypothetical protein
MTLVSALEVDLVHDRPRLSAGQVTSHHQMSAIRLVDGTCAGLEWIGAQNQVEYPFAACLAWAGSPTPSSIRADR